MENIYHFDNKNTLYKFIDKCYLLTSIKENSCYFDYTLCNFNILKQQIIIQLMEYYNIIVNYCENNNIVVHYNKITILVDLHKETIYHNNLLSKVYQHDNEYIVIKEQCLYFYNRHYTKELHLQENIIIDNVTYYLIYKQNINNIYFSDLIIQNVNNKFHIIRNNYPLLLICNNNAVESLIKQDNNNNYLSCKYEI
jgi:hypothetical protein